MTKTLKFYKDDRADWYVDLPEWEGEKAELQMVAGADTMLDIMSQDGDNTTLTLSDEPFDGADELEFMGLDNFEGGGAHYVMRTHMGLDFNLEMWLCHVTTFVFGLFPYKIWIK